MEKCLRDRNHVKWNILLAIQANQNIKCETIGIAIENRCETQIACYYLTIYMAINIFFVYEYPFPWDKIWFFEEKLYF